MAIKAYEMPVKTLTGIPAVDFSSARYTFVNFNADGNIVAATAAGNAIGIIQEPNGIGQPAPVMFLGISFVIFDGAVASGADVEVGTGAKAKTHGTGTVVGTAVVGGADGDIGCVLLK